MKASVVRALSVERICFCVGLCDFGGAGSLSQGWTDSDSYKTRMLDRIKLVPFLTKLGAAMPRCVLLATNTHLRADVCFWSSGGNGGAITQFHKVIRGQRGRSRELGECHCNPVNFRSAMPKPVCQIILE